MVVISSVIDLFQIFLFLWTLCTAGSPSIRVGLYQYGKLFLELLTLTVCSTGPQKRQKLHVLRMICLTISGYELGVIWDLVHYSCQVQWKICSCFFLNTWGIWWASSWSFRWAYPHTGCCIVWLGGTTSSWAGLAVFKYSVRLSGPVQDILYQGLAEVGRRSSQSGRLNRSWKLGSKQFCFQE